MRGHATGHYNLTQRPKNDRHAPESLLPIHSLAITDKLLSGAKFGTLEHDRLHSLNHKILKVTDMYRPEAWGEDEMKIAGEVFDKLNDNIAEAFKTG